MPRAAIASKQAKFTLLKLHAELGGKIIDNRKEAERLRAAMKHVEAVLRLLEPGYNVRPIAVRRRKGNPWFKRGTILRHALDVLRKADGPLKTREVVRAMLATRGVMSPTSEDVRDLCGSVASSLWNYNGKGVVAHDQTTPVRWTIKP